MPTNPFFNEVTYEPEQSLVNDLIVEAIQIYGHSAYYLRREDVNINPLFYEDPLARYPNASEIEIYLKNNMSFAGSSEVFSKFGLVIEDQATFLVAATRFASIEPTLSRPRENDIIYIQFTPTNRYLFEIRFVENKEQLFQLGRLYTYELRCEMMNFSHERIQTGIPEVDGVSDAKAYTLNIQLVSGNGDYAVGETIYEGVSFLDALATGTVSAWDADALLLSVQNITGEFDGSHRIVGVTSSANYTSAAPATDTTPTVNDPVSDNHTLNTLSPTIVIPQNNPRYN